MGKSSVEQLCLPVTFFMTDQGITRSICWVLKRCQTSPKHFIYFKSLSLHQNPLRDGFLYSLYCR
jgi:hypothetical protein